MTSNHFIGIDGKAHKCVCAEGRDPLLSRWRAGDYGTHPTWNDPLFWQSVARQDDQDGLRGARFAAKRNAAQEQRP